MKRKDDVDVVVIGAGAAGIAAARRLRAAELSVLVLEARDRVGGRAWTLRRPSGPPLDLGCGWLHSADENDWTMIAADLGFAIDATPPPWGRSARTIGMPEAERRDFYAAWERFYACLDAAADVEPDRAAADFLVPGCRWNALLNAVSTYINGVELDRLSVHDFSRYHDTGVNRRVEKGYGALMEAYAAPLDIVRACPATRIDHGGARVRIETAQGAVTASSAVVAVPTSIIARELLRFSPALPEKIQAAAALPLGLADKLFLQVEEPDDLPPQTRLFGSTDRTATGSYHVRPFGAALIEGYFGGELARGLEAEGEGAFAAFALDELAAAFGNDIRKRLSPIAASAWGRDPFALGSYSAAQVGQANARSVLAAPVDDRLFFAGEACSRHDFSTAHGAHRTGVAAAEQVIGVLRRLRLEQHGLA
jgi:monoamine oxidase